MKYGKYSTAAACGALLCATVLDAGSVIAAVDSRTTTAATDLKQAASAIMQNTSGDVLKIQVDKNQASAGNVYDAVVDVNGRIEAIQMNGASITPVTGRMPSWADGYTAHDTKDFAKAKVSIGEAIDAAAKQGDGAPVAAALMHDEYGPTIAYTVALAQPTGRVMIDARSGDTIPDSAPITLKP